MIDMKEKMDEYFSKYEIRTFIETGTHKGGAIEQMLGHPFDELHTVEIDIALCEENEDLFKDEDKVFCYRGDSLAFLKEVLPKVGPGAFIYLDAHLPGAYDGSNSMNSYPNETHRPMLEEFAIIKEYAVMPYVVYTDDVDHYVERQVLEDSEKWFGASHYIEYDPTVGHGHMFIVPREEYISTVSSSCPHTEEKDYDGSAGLNDNWKNNE